MVTGYIGRFGSGKTYSMVKDALKYVGHLTIAANFTLKGDIWGEWVFLESVYDLQHLSNCLVLVDEASIWFDNRQWSDKSMGNVYVWLTQSRKHGCHVWYTAQSEKGVDPKLTRNTAIYWEHEKYVWNWFRQRGYEPRTGEKFSSRWYRFSKAIGDLYNTGEIVGLKDGTGRKVAAIGQKIEDKMLTIATSEDLRILRECEGALVRESGPGQTARYRPALPSDIEAAEPHIRPGGRRPSWWGGRNGR